MKIMIKVMKAKWHFTPTDGPYQIKKLVILIRGTEVPEGLEGASNWRYCHCP
jgi:hypothetical protein